MEDAQTAAKQEAALNQFKTGEWSCVFILFPFLLTSLIIISIVCKVLKLIVPDIRIFFSFTSGVITIKMDKQDGSCRIQRVIHQLISVTYRLRDVLG